jgi:predicted AlkP superfamily pyrophosphatase or phosphodiesterase
MNMKKIIFLLLVTVSSGILQAQGVSDRPKLVVGIVVDQMRQEYLYRFQGKYSEGGFKRLMNDGFMLRNAHYNYAPTYTGPGHASVYTGTTPAIHGIIGNDFYDKVTRRMVNCVEDGRFKPVGNENGNGDVSPARMLSTTITDELKLFTQKKAIVIGLSVKDRGAVLPAGHMADAAYWYDGKTGTFITSTYYMSQLPSWMAKFHERKLADKYLTQEWKTYYPLEQYTESGPDDSPYESKLKGKTKAVFPYNLKELRSTNGEYELLASTPFANDYLTELAYAALEGEPLGKDGTTDFLAISYSTPDIIGHAVGPNAVELEDVYIRLDKNIEALLKSLDANVGKDNYTVFLTADHAVAEVPQYLRDNKIPAGYFNDSNVRANLEAYLLKYFPGREIIENMSNGQIFLNTSAFAGDLRSSGVDLLIATELITKYLMATEGIANVFSENTLRQADYDEGGMKGTITRGYHPKRSGDIVFVLEPGWFEASRVQGTTHGSPYSYDTHVPILFYGKGIPKGSSSQRHAITDIAPTLSVLLQIKFPSGTSGVPVSEMLDK